MTQALIIGIIKQLYADKIITFEQYQNMLKNIEVRTNI